VTRLFREFNYADKRHNNIQFTTVYFPFSYLKV
jgi:hypothetical protein